MADKSRNSSFVSVIKILDDLTPAEFELLLFFKPRSEYTKRQLYTRFQRFHTEVVVETLARVAKVKLELFDYALTSLITKNFVYIDRSFAGKVLYCLRYEHWGIVE